MRVHWRSKRQPAKVYDIRQNVLNLSYAELELDYGYIRAVTPYYSICDTTARNNDGWQKILSDRSPQATALKSCWTPKGAGYQIDMANAAEYSKLSHAELARYINDWEFAIKQVSVYLWARLSVRTGQINTKASQVRARYQVPKPLPKAPGEIQALADKLYASMLFREEEAIQKLRQVIEFATGNDCLGNALATYFGGNDAMPSGICGKCNFCLTGAGIDFTATASGKPDLGQVRAIMAACTVRDDPRLLARMAFGITSPRLTLNRWSTAHPLFGSMVNVDFNALVEAFDKECKKAGYVNADPPPPPVKTAQKRTYNQYSSASRGSSGGSSYYQGGSRGGGNSYRGGASKRARGWW